MSGNEEREKKKERNEENIPYYRKVLL